MRNGKKKGDTVSDAARAKRKTAAKRGNARDAFDPDEPRDTDGKWGSGGGGKASGSVPSRTAKIAGATNELKSAMTGGPDLRTPRGQRMAAKQAAAANVAKATPREDLTSPPPSDFKVEKPAKGALNKVQTAELYNLYHTARTALGKSPSSYDRKMYATKEFIKAHPEFEGKSKSVYLGFERTPSDEGLNSAKSERAEMITNSGWEMPAGGKKHGKRDSLSDRRRKTKEYDAEGREKGSFEEEDFDDAAPPLVSTPLVCVCDAAGGSDMMYDNIVLDEDAKVRFTDDGFMVATPRVARVGIQVYRGSECKKADMDLVRIYRPPEEVFSSDAMRSLTHRPMTLDHPAKPVTAGNWREHAVGQTGDEVLRDGNAIRVPMVLMDAAAISAFKDGKNQLSVGYDCDLDWTPGMTDGGERYDAVQRNIKANHVAIVAAARGGPTLRIGDETTGYETTNLHKQQETDMNMRTVLVDGVQCQMEDTAAVMVQRTITGLQDQVENFKKKLKEKQDEADEDDDESDAKDAALVKAADAIKAKDVEIAAGVEALKTKDAEIATIKAQLTDATDPVKVNARIVDRLGVISKAKVFMGDKWAVGTKPTEEIRREVVTSKVGDKAKTWSDAQVEASFESLQVPTFSQNREGQHTPIDDAIAAFGRPGAGYTTVQDERAKAYSDYDASLNDAWRTPAGTAKAN